MEQNAAKAMAAADKSHDDNKKLYTAALQLATLMYTTPDPQTLTTLRHMKRKLLSPPHPAPDQLPIDIDTQINKLLRLQPTSPPIHKLKTLIGNCTPPLVKQLTESDIKDNQARLALPKPYFRESIQPLLNRDEEDVGKGIPVTAYDADGKEYNMKLKKWAVDKVYVLTAGWKMFVQDHGLRHHEDFVTVWVFRKLDTGKLCVAITSRRMPVYRALKRNYRR